MWSPSPDSPEASGEILFCLYKKPSTALGLTGKKDCNG